MSERRSNTMVLLSRESLTIAIAAAGVLAQTSFGSGEFEYGKITKVGLVCATAQALTIDPEKYDQQTVCNPYSGGFGSAAANAALISWEPGLCSYDLSSMVTIATANQLTTNPTQLGIGGSSAGAYGVAAKGNIAEDACNLACFSVLAVADAESDLDVVVNFTLEQDTRIKVSVCELSRSTAYGSSRFKWELYRVNPKDIIQSCGLEVNGFGLDRVTPYTFQAPKGEYRWEVTYDTNGFPVSAGAAGCPSYDSARLISGDAWVATLNIVKFGVGP